LRSPSSSSAADYPPWTAPADAWPLRVDVQYDEDGPQLLCDAYVTRTLPTGTVIAESCCTAIYGSSLSELRHNLEQHIDNTRHVQPGFLNLPYSYVPE
jgi:hypothetical protein